MANISIYLNSRASQTLNSHSYEEFRKYLFRHQVNIYQPTDLDLLKKQISYDIQNKTDYIFSVGGDGTANVISQHLVGTDVKLMVVPAGTANDLASEIGSSANIKRITQIINNHSTKKIDVLRINEKYMITNGGTGIACEVASYINESRKSNSNFKKIMKTLGKNTYALMLAKSMITDNFKLREYFLESPDLPLLNPIVKSAMILINNQPILGGKFKVAPETKNDDGKFNVTILLHKTKLDLIKEVLPLISGGALQPSENVIMFETDKLTMNSVDGKPIEFFGDGEAIISSNIINIGIEQKALEVCTYKGQSLLCSSLTLDKIEMIQ